MFMKGKHLRVCCVFWFVFCLMAGESGWAQSPDLEQVAHSVTRYELLFAEGSDPSLLALELLRLIPLLPESVLQHVLRSDSILTTQNARDAVQSWWRSQDPLPASKANERMIEHVRRVQHALEHYACSGCATGYDARGEIHVRYGTPERNIRIVSDDPRLIDAVFQPGIAVSLGDFPENEFWRYLNLHRDAYFLFVRDGDRYRLGDTSDLLPSVLRAGIGHGGRGQVKSRMLMAVMRSVYQQLALEHADFGARFNDVDQWLLANEPTGRLRWRDPVANAKIVTGARLLTQGERAEPSEFGRTAQPASIIAQSILLGAQTEDQQAAYQREILLPPTSSDVFQAIPQLGMGMRHARFLDPDGTTTTEIYWHPEPGGLQVSGHMAEEGYVIQTYAERRNSDYRPSQNSTDAIRVQMMPRSRQAANIPVQIIQMHGGAGLYHLALQWDQYEIVQGKIGERVQVRSISIDSLHALDASGMTLEMSDLKPLSYTDANESFPWPHGWFPVGARFGLEFEIYHLTYGANDWTSYTVTYEVSAKHRRKSSTSVELEGRSRVEREEILLDLGQRSGEILITVTVQDHVSGHEVSRSLGLQVQDDQG